MTENEHAIVMLHALKERLLINDDLVILSALMPTNTDLIIETNYGPLFLDEEDFEKFKFDPQYISNTIGECIELIDVLNSYEHGLSVIKDKQDPKLLNLVTNIKIYYMDQLIEKLKKGEIKYEDII